MPSVHIGGAKVTNTLILKHHTLSNSAFAVLMTRKLVKRLISILNILGNLRRGPQKFFKESVHYKNPPTN